MDRLAACATGALFLICLASFPPSAAGADPGCVCEDVTFYANSSHGLMKTPRYPLTYCGNANCNWTILAGAENEAIRLHFDHFDISYYDYFIISYSNDGKNFVPVEKFSGSYKGLRDFITGKGQSIRLNFRTFSSPSYSTSGILMEFQRFNVTKEDCACGEFMYNATGSNQDIVSPGYPDEYCHRMKCYYYIHSSSKSKGVEVTFDKVDFENDKDAIYIYDHFNPEEVVNARARRKDVVTYLSGSRKGERTFKSKGRSVLAIFFSSGDVSKTGFHASFKEYDNPCHCDVTELKTDKNGTFSSPGFPDYECEELKCEYKLMAPKGKLVQVTFSPYSLATTDRLMAVDKTGVIIRDWKGKGLGTPSTFTSNTNEISFKYETSKTPGNGFNATFTLLDRDDECKCPDQILQSINGKKSGKIESPKWPKTNCGPMDCFYNLPRMSGSMNRLQLKINVTLVGGEDFLKLWKGSPNNTGVAKEYQSYAGKHSDLILTELNDIENITIQFHSGRVKDTKTDALNGFSLQYTWKDACKCGQKSYSVNKTKQSLKSPFYPDEYCNNVNCQWILQAAEGERVVLEIEKMALEKTGDFLSVYDGKTTAERLFS